ncbi:NAD+ synthase [Legionella micdadei]|uniref:Glutamine-dependent NAD(+) synthetase n=1 Tax=Legionella micdadei TaxID=451 RepID=A0A098GG33_LEGMI|nr:NAD+ synthase [Legionella micdadei]ARG97133.1 NAD+ synthase [Legionella micdadei]ARH00608.1 NAD+ synthase [Legionella micdadei]KTD29272.1 glutamine dependent NAD+ synthetase [Legionella micdadei]NSL17355.1 NAD+ synthase [Legionella micdadei]CEG61428.1 putative glutamine-dependent NAD(+) synthetase [Legionella micdadei]
MHQPLKILMAQINPTVGAIEANTEKIINIILQEQQQHDVIIFPELTITGYPPEDLLFRKELHERVTKALVAIEEVTADCHVVVGHPYLVQKNCFNAATVFYQASRVAIYFKQILPNYGVFDEERYFVPGPPETCILQVKNHRLGLCICEDIWQKGPVDRLIKAGVDAILCINASPFDYSKPALRENLIREYAQRGVAFIYVNQIGGQDELVFDGQSMALDHSGVVCARSPAFKEHLHTVILAEQKIISEIIPAYEQDQLIYEALVCGTRDYVEKNGFSNGVLIGLSGGIDSALTLAIAVDALGISRVQAVMMPSRYTADMSLEDAQLQINAMGVESTLINIEPIFNCFLDSLAPAFIGLPPDITEENLQARVRGMLLMALSNKSGRMVLTTSNKSETAVGYATIYGDMAGGFAVLKDVLKTQVYALATYRNRLEPVIPERVIQRAPSAELRANQTDQDSLPEYAVLDAIIKDYMENDLAAADIIQKGYRPEIVNQVIRLIQRNEYKRRQAAPGIKISTRAFGRDWRYPITSGY